MPLIVDSPSLVPKMSDPAPKTDVPSVSDETTDALPASPTNETTTAEPVPSKDSDPMPDGLVELLSPVPDDATAPQPIKHSEPETAPEAIIPSQFPTESAPWQAPLDVAVGPDGSYFIADRKLPGVWRMKDGQTTEFYKGPKNPRAPMGAVRSLFVAADGTLFAGDAATKDVYSISPSGEIKSLSRNSVGIPNSISVVDGTLYVADIEQQKIWRLPAAGLGIAQQPTEFADVPGCRGLYIDELGFIWVVSTIQPQLRRYTGDGKFDPVLENVTFEFPQQVCVTIEGTVYVTDSAAKTVWRIERGGQPEKWLTSPHLSTPNRILQQGEHFIVGDAKANSLFRVSKFASIELMINGSNTTAESTAKATETTPPNPAAGNTTAN